MKFYKGDIVHDKKDKRDIDHKSLWAMDLIGILSDFETERMVLFYRPFRNRIKQLRDWLIK